MIRIYIFRLTDYSPWNDGERSITVNEITETFSFTESAITDVKCSDALNGTDWTHNIASGQDQEV